MFFQIFAGIKTCPKGIKAFLPNTYCMGWYQSLKSASPNWLHVDPIDTESKAYRFYQYLKSNNIRVPLYHGTSKNRYQKILKNGFMLSTQYHGEGQEQAQSPEGVDPDATGANKLFFTRQMGYAAQYALPAVGNNYNDSMEILKVEVPLYMIEEIRVAILLPDKITYNESEHDATIKDIFYLTRRGKTRAMYDWRNDTNNEQKLQQLLTFMSKVPEFKVWQPDTTDEFTVRTALPTRFIKGSYDEKSPEFWAAFIEAFPQGEGIPDWVKSNAEFMERWAKIAAELVIADPDDVYDTNMPQEVVANPVFQKLVVPHFLNEIKTNYENVLSIQPSMISIPKLKKPMATAYWKCIKQKLVDLEKLPAEVRNILMEMTPKGYVAPSTAPQTMNVQGLMSQLNTQFSLPTFGQLMTQFGGGQGVKDYARGLLSRTLLLSKDPTVLQQAIQAAGNYFPTDKDVMGAANQAKKKMQQPSFV